MFNQLLTRQLATLVAIIFLLANGKVAFAQTFNDVPENAWYYDYVEQLVSDGIVEKDANFQPNFPQKRAELIQWVITASNGLNGFTAPTIPTFSDVPASSPYYQYVEAAFSLGIVNGYTDSNGKFLGIFGPDDSVTRAAATKILVNAFKLPTKLDIGSSFPDINPSDWFHDFVMTAYNYSVLDGYDNGWFGPADSVTQAQMAKLIVNAQAPKIRTNPSIPVIQTPSSSGPVKAFQATAPHPRLWIDNDMIARLKRERSASSTFWQQIVRCGDDSWGDVDKPMCNALLYQVLKTIPGQEEEADSRAQNAISEILSAMQGSVMYGDGQGNEYRHQGMYFPIIFDWTFDKLTENQKSRLSAYMIKGVDFNVANRNILEDSDQFTGGTRTDLFVGIALAGYSDRGMEIYNGAVTRFEKGVRDAVGVDRKGVIQEYIVPSQGGLWMEGNLYNPDTLKYIFEYASAIKTLTNRDIFQEIEKQYGFNFPKDVVRGTLALYLPNYEGVFTYSSIEEAWWPVQTERFSALLANVIPFIKGTDEAKWAEEFVMNAPSGYEEYDKAIWSGFDAYLKASSAAPFLDPNLPTKSLTTLPLNHYAKGPGILISKTSNQSSGAGVFLQLGKIKRVDHVDFDTLGFQMYKNGEWVTREARGYGMFTSQTAIHNGILIDGVGGDEKSAFGFTYGKPKAKVSLCSDFSFASSDASDLYNVDRINNRETWEVPEDRTKEVTREFLFDKQNEWLVVFDRIETLSASAKKELFFRTLMPTTVSDGKIMSKTIKPANASGTTPQERNQPIAGTQNVLIQTVYPTNATQQLVSEKTFFSNGIDFLDSNDPAEDWSVHPSEKRWHTKVTLPSNEKRGYALNVVLAYDSSAPTITAVSENNYEGVKIVQNGNGIEVVFAKIGTADGKIRRITNNTVSSEKALTSCGGN